MLIDTHAHIQEAEFDDDRDAAIARAAAAGVSTIIVPGVDARTSEAAVALAEKHGGVYAAVGYHPHEASRMTPADLRSVEGLVGHPKVVAIGEIGLDFYRMHSPQDRQIETLEAMLDLALRHKLPVVVHCREARETLTPALETWAGRARPAFGGRPVGVMHYFSGSADEARSFADAGFAISIHTSVTHPRSEGLREVAGKAPIEALVVETDSPYGAPQSRRGKRNEPAFVVEAAKAIAEARSLGFEETARATTANAARLFALPLGKDERTGTGAAV